MDGIGLVCDARVGHIPGAAIVVKKQAKVNGGGLIGEGNRQRSVTFRVCGPDDDIVVVEATLAIGAANGDDHVEAAVVVADSGGVDAL